ncbi:hypothetical protein [Alicyclobacillus sp. SO9]|uniref:hypothetical protein n=1 Tax=Alicyclobacillus sp. SO9 TaxID=2665646 RepID=UPI0018E86B71|nr:hypothetical protein [Alicyclobacillus sp. SO9]QQE79623.1 hypothetical protein GI364_03785 [Alicyclobacillus sp. SO9]
MNRDVDFTQVHVHSQVDAPPFTQWFAQEIEHWIRQTEKLETDVRIGSEGLATKNEG